jgi:hypothetical protein
MKEFIATFTAREIASIVWIIIVFFATLFNKELRKSYWDIQKTLFSKPLVIIGCSFFVYTFLEAYFLQKVGFWFNGSKKDFLFWVLLSALPSIALFSKVDDNRFLGTYLRSLFGFIILVEFVNSSYTYNFWIEFFLVLPILSFLTLLIVSNENASKSDWASASMQKVLTWIFAIVGFIVAFNSFKLFFEDLENLSVRGVLIELFMPIILSIGFLPFIYFFSLYIKLERIYLPLKTFVKVQKPIHLMLQAFWKSNFDIELVEKWKDRLLLRNRNVTKGLVVEMEILREELEYQNSSKYLPLTEGWGIASSKGFLKNFNLLTGDYKREDEKSNKWYACSSPLYIGEAIVNNNLAYYLDGFYNKVTELKLKNYLPNQY